MTEKQAAVSELQRYLRNISRADSDIKAVIPDGAFGQETAESVRSFQKKYGLEETGVVDYEVWTKIKKENDKVVFLSGEKKASAVIPDSDLPLKKGDRGKSVYHLKLMLFHLAQTFSNFDIPEINDVFDDKTEKAVMNWQRVIGESENGQADRITLELLSEYYLL